MHRCQRLVHSRKILELVLWNGLQSCHCITPDAISVIKMPSFQYFFIFRNRKKSLGARSSEQAGCSNTVICLVAKNSSLLLFFGELLWDHFCTHLPQVKIFSYDFPNCFSVDVQLLWYAPDSQRWFSCTIWRTFAMFSSIQLVAGHPDLSSSVTISLPSEKPFTHL